MSICPFCKQDPFEYVDIGVGYAPVAVNCCDLGIGLYRGEKIPQQILTLRRSHSPRKKAKAKRMMEQYA